jgi:predicted RNase H-like nuclease (RuvC/YqgF family)
MTKTLKIVGLAVGAAFLTGAAISAGIIFANTYINQKRDTQERFRKTEEETKAKEEIIKQREEEIKTLSEEINVLKEKIETVASVAFTYEDHYREVSDAITSALVKIKEFVDMPMFTETKELSRKVNEIKKTISSLVDLIETINEKLQKTEEEENANGN